MPSEVVPILSRVWYHTLTAVTSKSNTHVREKCDQATLYPRKAYFTDGTTGADRLSCATTQPSLH